MVAMAMCDLYGFTLAGMSDEEVRGMARVSNPVFA